LLFKQEKDLLVQCHAESKDGLLLPIWQFRHEVDVLVLQNSHAEGRHHMRGGKGPFVGDDGDLTVGRPVDSLYISREVQTRIFEILPEQLASFLHKDVLVASTSDQL
jgi:hypothetical protein